MLESYTKCLADQKTAFHLLCKLPTWYCGVQVRTNIPSLPEAVGILALVLHLLLSVDVLSLTSAGGMALHAI